MCSCPECLLKVIPILKKPTVIRQTSGTNDQYHSLFFLKSIKVCSQSTAPHLLQNNLQDPNQSVFKAARSTETALVVVTEKLQAS